MKIIEINNREGTYIYDEEYNEFFSGEEEEAEDSF